MLDDTFLLDAFTVRLGDIMDVEPDALHALSLSVGWPHRAEDWQLLREVGQGVVALDSIGRVYGSAMWFPFGDDFATVGMVITPPRLQANGGGLWLMRHALARTQGRSLGLHATEAAHRLCLSLGFVDERTVYQCQGEATMPPDVVPPAEAEVRDLRPSDFAALCELDRRARGADRANLLASLVARSRGIVLCREGNLEAVALCRPFGRGSVVGPVIAATDEDAIAVVLPLVAEHAGTFLRIDTGQMEGDFARFVALCGLPVYDTVTQMSFGRPWVPETAGAHVVYALASHTTG
jgi:GNAT superfamily N-acetyltransferase